MPDDLGALLTRQAEQDVLAEPQRLLRLVRLGQAACFPEHDKGAVQELAGRVHPQCLRERPRRALVVAQGHQRIPLMKEQLPLGVAECRVVAVRRGQLTEHVVGTVERAPDPVECLAPASPGHPGQRPRLDDRRHDPGRAEPAASQVSRGPGQRRGLPRIAVVQRHQRLADSHPGAEPPVAGLISRGPGGPEEGPGQPVVAKVDHQIGTRSKVFGEFLFNPTNYLQARLPWTGVTAQLKGFNDSGTPWYQLMLRRG